MEHCQTPNNMLQNTGNQENMMIDYLLANMEKKFTLQELTWYFLKALWTLWTSDLILRCKNEFQFRSSNRKFNS